MPSSWLPAAVYVCALASPCLAQGTAPDTDAYDTLTTWLFFGIGICALVVTHRLVRNADPPPKAKPPADEAAD